MRSGYRASLGLALSVVAVLLLAWGLKYATTQTPGAQTAANQATANTVSIVDTEPIQARFDEAYSAWHKRWIQWGSLHSDTPHFVRNPEFEALVALGVPVLPHIAEKMEDANKSDTD